MTELMWNKPVISLYLENNQQPETEALAVIKASKLTVSESINGEFEGKITDFFSLMGDIDKVNPENRYVACWFDDSVEDFHAGFRRLSGVTFLTKLNFTVDRRNKRTYNANFQAKRAKLK